MSTCCEELEKITLNKLNDERISIDLESPKGEAIDFSTWTAIATIDYLYDGEENFSTPNLTITENIIDSFKSYVSIPKEMVADLKGNEVLSIIFTNGSGEQQTLSFLLTVCV